MTDAERLANDLEHGILTRLDALVARVALLEANMSPSEAVYAFAGWLTCLPSMRIGATECATPVADLVTTFMKAQGWAEPRHGWSEKIKTVAADHRENRLALLEAEHAASVAYLQPLDDPQLLARWKAAVRAVDTQNQKRS